MEGPTKQRLHKAVFAIALVLFLEGCHGVAHTMLCRDSAKTEIFSPDQRNRAIVVADDCGAAAASTVVKLRRNRSWFSRQIVAFGMPGIQPIQVLWRGNEHLEVIASTCDPQTVNMQNWQGITVTCKTR